MSPRVRLTLDVNGKRHHLQVAPMKRLLDVLRQECGLTGTKEGCGEGECGACSVLMDGKSVCSCLVSAAQAEGAKIVTVEGLAKNGTLTRLQKSFVELGAAQCGICTPGMLVTAVELLDRAHGRVPGEAEVREALAGNLCRCTGYQKIVDAVRATARATARPAKPGGGVGRVAKGAVRAAATIARSRAARTIAKAVIRRALKSAPRRPGSNGTRKPR